MHHPSSKRLALVADRPEPERVLNEARPARPVAYRLEEILRQRRQPGAIGTTHPTTPGLGLERAPDRLPFAMHLTMAQILEVAEDAEIRAELIDDVGSTLDAGTTFLRRIEGAHQTQRRVDSLREAARGLRSVATQIMDSWAGPERSS